MTKIKKVLSYLDEKEKSNISLSDRHTSVMKDFSKIAQDELSKANIDTNDNGIDRKELEKITDQDLEENDVLTPGQKSLAWESYQDKVKKAMSERLKKEVNEISDELKNRVADKRKENLDKALAKYTKNQALNQTHSKANIKKAEPKQSWSYFAGGLCPSIYLEDMNITLYMPCPEEGYPNWNLYLDDDDSTPPTKQFKSMPTIQDIEKAIKEDIGEDVKLPDYGEAGKKILAAYEEEYGKAEPKVAWDTSVQSDHIMVWAPLKFKGNIDDLVDYAEDADLISTDNYDGLVCDVDLWSPINLSQGGWTIRLSFPETTNEDYIWFALPSYEDFTKFLKNYIYPHVGDNLLEGMKILDNLIKENSTEGESNGSGTPEEAGKIVKEIINYLRKNGGGTLYNDHFEVTENGARWDIRDWGVWENPEDAEDEEDYDWQVLEDSYKSKLQSIIADFKSKYSNYDITYDIGEKNYIGIYVTVKSKNEGFNDLKVRKPRLKSLADDITDLAKDTVVNTAHALTGGAFRKRRKVSESREHDENKTMALAQYLGIDPSEIESSYDEFYTSDNAYIIYAEDEIMYAIDRMVTLDFEKYLPEIIKDLSANDFVELFCEFQDSQFVVDKHRIVNYGIDHNIVDIDDIYDTTNYNNSTFYIREK